jgi:pilus assembly protein Flp/PilA
MRQIFARFVRDEAGVAAVEYALLASLITVLIVPALTTLGANLSDTYDNIASALK